MDRETTLNEVRYSWELASRKGTNLERLIFGLGYILARCPDDCVVAVQAAICNAQHRLMYTALAKEKP